MGIPLLDNFIGIEIAGTPKRQIFKCISNIIIYQTIDYVFIPAIFAGCVQKSCNAH